jgi:hypothetical protein
MRYVFIVTFKPGRVPLKLSVPADHLTAPDDYFDAQSGFPKRSSVDQVFRHFNFAGKILVHRNVDLLGRIQSRHSSGPQIEHGGNGTGINVGFSFRVKAIEFTFSRRSQVAGQAAYTF